MCLSLCPSSCAYLYASASAAFRKTHQVHLGYVGRLYRHRPKHPDGKSTCKHELPDRNGMEAAAALRVSQWRERERGRERKTERERKRQRERERENM